MLPREEFSSRRGESTIYLGHFKNKSHKLEKYDEKMFSHGRSYELSQLEPAQQGLDQTRFHKGFQRRHQSKIDNPLAETSQMNAQAKNTRQESIATMRSQIIKAHDAKTGFDIITGAPRGSGPPRDKPMGIKKVGDGLGPEASTRGKSILRESAGRFFTPLSSGHNHEHRQNVLYKEGLLIDKYCGVLDPHKSDMRSYGVEDQFSKSEYTKNTEVTRTGLNESRVPGKFTPRKIENHPAGYPAIVEKWTTNIDLNNRTLKCTV
jgi:hypothetical protein